MLNVATCSKRRMAIPAQKAQTPTIHRIIPETCRKVAKISWTRMVRPVGWPSPLVEYGMWHFPH